MLDKRPATFKRLSTDLAAIAGAQSVLPEGFKSNA
jgi:hypothetical protein